MATWKRKKYEVPTSSHTKEAEEISPLGDLSSGALCQWHVSTLPAHQLFLATAVKHACALSLQAEGPSIQALALAALNSGQSSSDIEELASLGNYGKNLNHVAQQLHKKYCHSSDIDTPFPYTLDCPVLLKKSDCICLCTRKVGMFLPHQWFHWMCDKEGVSGLQGLSSFWEEHSLDDPQIQHSPVKDSWNCFNVLWQDARVLGSLCSYPLLPLLPLQHLRKGGRNSFLWGAMVMEVLFRRMTA